MLFCICIQWCAAWQGGFVLCVLIVLIVLIVCGLWVCGPKDQNLCFLTRISCSSRLSLVRRPPLLQVADLKLRKTIVMQCYWRGYRARCRAHDMREGLEERKRRIREEEAQARVEAEERHKKEVERRMHPRKFEDFEILYNELEAWRAHETRRIKDANMDDAERMAALSQLLHKETKLLQAIDRFKLTANGENRDLRIKKMLELMADPKKWEVSIIRIRTCGGSLHTRLVYLPQSSHSTRKYLLSKYTTVVV